MFHSKLQTDELKLSLIYILRRKNIKENISWVSSSSCSDLPSSATSAAVMFTRV